MQRADGSEARLSVSKRGNSWTCGFTSGDRHCGPTRGMPKQAVAAWLATHSGELDAASASATWSWEPREAPEEDSQGSTQPASQGAVLAAAEAASERKRQAAPGAARRQRSRPHLAAHEVLDERDNEAGLEDSFMELGFDEDLDLAEIISELRRLTVVDAGTTSLTADSPISVEAYLEVLEEEQREQLEEERRRLTGRLRVTHPDVRELVLTMRADDGPWNWMLLGLGGTTADAQRPEVDKLDMKTDTKKN